MRDIFCTGGGSPPPHTGRQDELPWSRIFFTEAVFCPRRTGSPLALETVAQCASLHLRQILSQPSIKVILCLGDDAVQAVTGRYRWEPWKALHGRVQQRDAAPSLVYAVHPMAAREGGGQPWSRQVRGKLCILVDDMIDTGGTIVKATDALLEEGAADVVIATTHGIRQAVAIVDTLYNAAGATAIYESHLLQRHFQDVHVISQHMQARMSHYELVGRHWLGLPIDEARL